MILFPFLPERLMLKIRRRCVGESTNNTHTAERTISLTDVENLFFFLHLIISGFLIYFVFGTHLRRRN